jgi:hypothetical protein
MSLKNILIAAILIIYSLEGLDILHWSFRVVLWLILILGLVYAIEEIFGARPVPSLRRREQ